MEPKLVHVLTGEPVCKTCNLDPVNRMTDMLRDIDSGDATEQGKEQLVEFLATTSSGLVEGLNKLHPGISARAQATADAQQKKRKLIPLTTT